MGNRTSKDIIIIKIDNEPFTCFVMEDGKIFVEEKINKFFNAGYDKGTITNMAMMPGEIDGQAVYALKVVADNLRPRLLKQLAEDGLFHRVHKAIEERDNPKERILSEFDKMLLKALYYNPKERGV